MVGWLYIEGQVAAPVHVLDVDLSTGVMGIEIAGKFVPDRAALRGEVVVEYYAWQTRRLVRCLGAERVGTQLLIEAVDVGHAGAARDFGDSPESEAAAASGGRGDAEDWLVVDGTAICQVGAFTSGAARGSGVGHCMMHVSRDAWRALRVGEQAPLAAVGSTVVTTALPAPGTITPKLSPTPLAGDSAPASVKVVRLRERMIYHLTPLASDWADDSTLVVARVDAVEGIGARSHA